MVINSMNFLAFFTIVFLVYYLVVGKSKKLQNAWLLIVSYVFYGIAEWKMIPLLALATIIFYSLGLFIQKIKDTNEKKASILTTIGTCLGIGFLLYFKYLNFFIDSFITLFDAIGFNINHSTFNIIMPLGLSYFTFKLIAYIIEVHRGHINAERDIISFGTFIAFFPTILSGPIDRPKNFLSQLSQLRSFNYNIAVEGCRLILWGLFKKLLVADNLAMWGDSAWSNWQNQSGLELLFASILYLIYMYADFSGYSDMAIGVGKLLNIKVQENFKQPFFSRNVAEYWRAWHISLTSWLTDYVFMPLNIRFRQLETHGTVIAIVINMILVGMWHGANWTFVLFGLYHGILFLPLMYNGTFFKKNKIKLNSIGLLSFKDSSKMLLTFILCSFGLIIFRSESCYTAFNIITKIFTDWGRFSIEKGYWPSLAIGIFFAIWILIKDYYDKFKPKEMLLMNNPKPIIRWFCYFVLVSAILLFSSHGSNASIYFQF